MIQEIFRRLDAFFSDDDRIDDSKKEALKKASGDLKKQVDELSKTHEAHALGIASMTKLSVEEKFQDNPTKSGDTADRTLSEIVREFEVTNPELDRALKSLLSTLSSLGI